MQHVPIKDAEGCCACNPKVHKKDGKTKKMERRWCSSALPVVVILFNKRSCILVQFASPPALNSREGASGWTKVLLSGIILTTWAFLWRAAVRNSAWVTSRKRSVSMTCHVWDRKCCSVWHKCFGRFCGCSRNKLLCPRDKKTCVR